MLFEWLPEKTDLLCATLFLQDPTKLGDVGLCWKQNTVVGVQMDQIA